MEDRALKGLTQLVFACIKTPVKHLGVELVYDKEGFKINTQLMMMHEVVELVAVAARKILGIRGDINGEITKIIQKIIAENFSEEIIFSENVSVEIPKIPTKKAEPNFDNCFSEKMHEYILSRANEQGVTPDGVIGAMLAACSAAIPAQCQLKIGDTYSEHATIWVSLVGMCSTKKTSTLKTGIKFFEKKQSEYSAINKTNKKQYKKEMARFEVEMADFRKKAVSNKFIIAPEEPEEKPHKDVYLSDATIEALLQSCADNSRGVLYFRDEMSAWLGQLTRRDAERERAQWLEGYNAGRHEQARIGRGRIEIPCFRTVILGGLQPSIVEKMLQDELIDGLAARFILVRHDNQGEPTNSVSKIHLDYIDNLLDVLFQNDESVVELSLQAKEFFAETCREYARELNSMPNTHWRAFLGKRSGLLARITLIFHAIEMAEHGLFACKKQVTLLIIERAKRFMSKFIQRSAEVIYSAAGVQVGDEDAGIVFGSTERNVVRWLRERQKRGIRTVTTRDIQVGCRAYQDLKKRRLDTHFIDSLAASGLVEVTTGERGQVMISLLPCLGAWGEI